MARGLSNYTTNGSSTTDEYGTFKGLSDLLVGDVITGFAVVPNGTANMTVLVQPGSARISTGTAPANYGYWVYHDTIAGESVTITAASTSPRIDYIVAYVDKGVTGSPLPANVNNTNNVFKFAAVAGTPASSPAVPTTSQINTAIGAANPYIILAQVAVAANATQITAPNVTDKRSKISTVRKSVDANGWTIYDYGTYKVYKNRGTQTVTVGGNTWVNTTGLASLPVGVSSLGANFIEGSASADDYAIRCQLRPQATDGAITVTMMNSFTGSITTTLYWSASITTP